MLRRFLKTGLQFAVTGAVLGYLFMHIDAAKVWSSVARIPPIRLLAALLASALAVASGIVRWRLLCQAYGALARPRWGELAHWYFVSMFYNLLPGSVGGDVLRGYATRRYFADGAAAQSVGVVFVERVLGLAGLFVLSGMATLLGTRADEDVLLYSALGLCTATAAIAQFALARMVAPWLPRRLLRLVRSLPVLVRVRPFAAAVAISVLTHLMVTLAGYLLISSLTTRVSVSEALAIFSVGTLASYFPLTVGGAGTREATLVALFARLGVSEADALASSLSLFACQLFLAALGGLLQRRAVGGSKADPTNPTRARFGSAY